MPDLLRKHQSVVVALGILLLLVVWFASGIFAADEATPANAEAAERSIVQKVRVRTPVHRRIVDEVVLNGRTEPARAISFRAEAEGRVMALEAQRGDSLTAGDPILRIDVRDRQARLARRGSMPVFGRQRHQCQRGQIEAMAVGLAPGL